MPVARRGAADARGALTHKDYIQPPKGSSARFIRMWENIVHDHGPEYFRKSFRAPLESYVHITIALEDAREQFIREGSESVIEGLHGPVANPLIKIINDYIRQQTALGRVLRLAPSSHQKTKDSMGTPLEEPEAPESGGVRLVG